MLIELTELIAYYSGVLQPHPTESFLDRKDVYHSTLVYLNAYRTTTTMLQNLAKGIIELGTEGVPS